MSPRLYLAVLSAEARRAMSYRVDFWINTVASFIAEFGVHYFLALALFAESGEPTIRGFRPPDLVIWYVGILLIAKLVRGNEIGGVVSQEIYDGSLSRYLVFPAPFLAIKHAQQLGALLPAAIQTVLLGLLATWVLDPPETLAVHAFGLVAAVVAVLLGNLLYYLVRLCLDMVAFWQDNVWTLSVTLRGVSSLLGGVLFPIAFFPGWGQSVVHWLPFRLMFEFPARMAFGMGTPAEFARDALLGCAWCVVFALVARAIWRRGTLQYTGVGI